MAKKRKVKIGDKVRIKVAKEAYYSRYAGKPLILLTPDIIGTIGAVHVAAVRGDRPYFNCIDFLSPATGKIERASAFDDEFTLVP